jgi:hypothetical protein
MTAMTQAKRDDLDLVERLRDLALDYPTKPYLREAADEIDRLRWALEEIIQSADLDVSTYGVPTSGYHCISTHLMDQARAALVAEHRGDSDA